MELTKKKKIECYHQDYKYIHGNYTLLCNDLLLKFIEDNKLKFYFVSIPIITYFKHS